MPDEGIGARVRALLPSMDVAHLPVRRRRGWLIRRMLVLADIIGLVTAFAIVGVLFPDELGARRRLSFEPPDVGRHRSRLSALRPGRGADAPPHDRRHRRRLPSGHDRDLDPVHRRSGGRCRAPELGKASSSGARPSSSSRSARAGARALCRRSPIVPPEHDHRRRRRRRTARRPQAAPAIRSTASSSSASSTRSRSPARTELDGHRRSSGRPTSCPSSSSSTRRRARDHRVLERRRTTRRSRLVRALNDADVQIDIVPRLFELVGPSVKIDTVEGLPLIGLPPARASALVAA